MKKKRPTSLFAILIAASLVAKSIAGSAWAMPNNVQSTTLAEKRLLVESLITEYFPPEAVTHLLAIAQCEAQGVHTSITGDLVANQSSSARGALQILMSLHEPRAHALGLSIRADIHDYFKYARHIYDKAKQTTGSGFSPWNTSRKCWQSSTLKHYVLESLRILKEPAEVAEAPVHRDLR